MRKLFLLSACMMQLGIFAAADNTPHALSASNLKLLGMEMSRDGSSVVYTHSTPSIGRARTFDGKKLPADAAHLNTLFPKHDYHITLASTSTCEHYSYELLDKPCCLRFDNKGKKLAIGLGSGKRYDFRRRSAESVAFFDTTTGGLVGHATIKKKTEKDQHSETADLRFNDTDTKLLETNNIYTYSHGDYRKEPIATDGNIILYDLESRIAKEIFAKNKLVGCCTFSDDGRLCAAQVANRIMLWDLRESEPKRNGFELPGHHTKNCFYFSPDNNTICSSSVASSTNTPYLNFLSVGEEKIIEQFELTDNTKEQYISPDGTIWTNEAPCVKVARACKKMIGGITPLSACTNAEETVLLYQESTNKKVFLAKAS